MRREDWRDHPADRERRLRDHDDYGQADYSNLYGYDPRTRSGYRAYDDGREPHREDGPYDDRAAREAWDYGPDRRPHTARRGPSDRVLHAIIMERLDDQHRLDLRDVDVSVRDAEVTLNGSVRHKADKRRIEDVADIEGVRNVQNNLRVRERSRWTLL